MRIVAFGDTLGVSPLVRNLPKGTLVGIAGAAIRAHCLDQLRHVAERCSVPFLVQPVRSSPDYARFVSDLAALRPDFIIVNSYSMKLYEDVLSLPGIAAVNIHGGLLPQYRGCNPTQWVLLNNEAETGVTMHYMDANFDTGDIIAQRRIPVLFEHTWLDVQQRLIFATEELLAEHIPLVLSGANSRTPQSEKQAHYWRRRAPEDGCFAWDWKIIDIYNLIRALVHPHPGAFYLDSNGNKIVIDRFIPYDKVRQMQVEKIGKVIE